MDKAAATNIDPGVMAAVDVPLDMLMEMIDGRADVHIGNINSPNQVILSGNTEAVKHLGERLKKMGYRCTPLRVSMAFHSPIMRVIHDELEAYIASIPFHSPKIPVISNTTMAPYPSDSGQIRRILMAHLESTVHWSNNVQTLWSDYGIRLFVEAGPDDILSNLITDTLPDATCIQTCMPPAECITYKTALAQLFVQGHLKVRREPMVVSLSAFGKTSASGRNIPNRQASPAIAETSEHQGLMEALIQIIMDATGFNRDEIQPDMDLRRDLSIRSSRLPIIMDAAERHFGITIELEDFINVRTVRDVAQSISKIVARKEGTSLPATMAAEPNLVQDESLKPLQDDASLKRLVFKSVPMELSASAPIRLSQGESVLFLSPDRDDDIGQNVGDIFRQDYGVYTIPMLFMQTKSAGQEGYDILTDEGSCTVSQRISSLASLAGMVITLPKGWSGKLKGIADVSRLLRGLFLPLKAFLQSPAKKFVVLIHCREDAETLGRLPAEGLLGMFLSASQEYSSVQFRTLEIDSAADLRAALYGALDRGYTAVEMAHCDGKVFTLEGHVAPYIFRNVSSLNLNPGDVVVISGGASGISAHLARGLVPFRPRLVFLGRTPVDTEVNSAKTASGQLLSESHISGHKAAEIAQTLADLHSLGIEAAYYTCDVTNPEAVLAIMGKVVKRYGRIDGIIHGAGVLRDGFLGQMTPDDFSMVTDVKFLGAWNLFSAAEKAGLKFFVGLSSVAAIQGNPGQTNYAAANRMMSALIRYLGAKNEAVRFKALMLPPIEGAGMADDPEVREMLKRKGVGYIHVNELAGLFCRELFVASADDDWVMFMRRLPAVKTAPLSNIIRPSLNGELDGGTMAFNPEDLPMIEGITSIDMRQGQLEAVRSFSLEKDIWTTDHKPFKFVKHPLVSAVMVLETFMEAARILYPHLCVRGVRQVRLKDMIQCPHGVPRPCRISCRRVDALPGEAMCEVSLSAQEMSPTGRLTDRFTPHYMGQVILDGGQGNLGEGLSDFPIRLDELRTRPVDHKKVLKWYRDRSGLDGRYRVIDFLDGAGTGVVRGRTTYRETSDFAHLQNAQYQYSPYLFEALMQLVGFYIAAIAPTQREATIPVAVGEMRFLRRCRKGEQIILEARMRMDYEKSFVWDARGIDDQGLTIMQVYGMRMQKVSEQSVASKKRERM
jgi:NAD(P)-dependent dehydrogenase (short-subunit alcohol dehydrogenase family)/acyl carrier protein